jgi:exfoliative toxin A/B
MSTPANDPAVVDDHLLKKVAKTAPIPMAGLMLGLASTGNMVSDYRWFFGFFAFAIMGILILKIIYDSKTVREELKNPGVVGVACTFPMGVAVLSTYIKPYAPDLAFTIWITVLVLHFILMVYFTLSFIIRKFDLRKALPAYFVVYVGFSVNAFIAPVYGQYLLGQILFWFGFISFLALLPPLLYRILVVKSLPEPLLPTIIIFASPASVCLFAYIRAFPNPDPMMVYILLAFSLVAVRRHSGDIPENAQAEVLSQLFVDDLPHGHQRHRHQCHLPLSAERGDQHSWHDVPGLLRDRCGRHHRALRPGTLHPSLPAPEALGGAAGQRLTGVLAGCRIHLLEYD